jgi:hypothetical protein
VYCRLFSLSPFFHSFSSAPLSVVTVSGHRFRWNIRGRIGAAEEEDQA